MNVIYVLRTYLGLSQAAMAREVGITQPDLSEAESMKPYGYVAKYLKLSDYLGVSVEALVKNDFTRIPLSFFDGRPAPLCHPEPEDPLSRLGRQGEEFILRRERERLQDRYPALAKLVLPHYKMKVPSPGYDILSFDDQGVPLALEVKTASNGNQNFRLTKHELDMAQKISEQGGRYVIVCISNWGEENQSVREISWEDLLNTHSISPQYYFCAPRRKEEQTTVCGLRYFRKCRGLRQVDAADALEVAASNYCLYENGKMRPSINFYIRASRFYGVTVDELLADYPVEA